MVITSEDYIKAVKAQYELAKLGDFASILLQPSPAQLRNMCLMFLDKGLTPNDEHQFRIFFQAKENENLRRTIEQFDVEKFKPIGRFFKGKSESTSMPNLELIAILIDFPIRPLRIFLKNERSESITHEEVSELDSKDGDKRRTIEIIPAQLLKKKFLITFFVIVGLLPVSYVAKDACFPSKECMQWQNDQYVVVDCEIKGFASIHHPIVLDEDLLSLKKVELKAGMKFFEYGKPLYYYHKYHNDVEFFNGPGLHPKTGKPLREATMYMINKYALKK